jgi:hypothetical protein
MIPDHATGHVFAPDGHLLRVDKVAGRWVASRWTRDHKIAQQVYGTDEVVHQQISRWLSKG